ncbi:MAG: hypothetical protein PHU12_00800 [Candidatus Aenigmarchaeota archaeon]|nr:hypothetical protein [Candidatus Aenigmarchaeota archaeon]
MKGQFDEEIFRRGGELEGRSNRGGTFAYFSTVDGSVEIICPQFRKVAKIDFMPDKLIISYFATRNEVVAYIHGGEVTVLENPYILWDQEACSRF